MTELIRVIVADDHPLYLEGLIAALAASPDIGVIGQAVTAAGALRLAREHLPDVALLDITMPGGGLEAARQISLACPATRIVMLTASEDEDDVIAALKAGASGYILKGVAGRELLDILRTVAAGEVYVAPRLAWLLLRELSRPRKRGPLEELTARERTVLELVANGLGNQAIGDQLGLAEKTI
ncbi:MAG TPA: response regulator transcription factor, partial [Chloroflexota bacterium]|nr:response regulator transcription factor [Chloroflexota bacterium]